MLLTVIFIIFGQIVTPLSTERWLTVYLKWVSIHYTVPQPHSSHPSPLNTCARRAWRMTWVPCPSTPVARCTHLHCTAWVATFNAPKGPCRYAACLYRRVLPYKTYAVSLLHGRHRTGCHGWLYIKKGKCACTSIHSSLHRDFFYVRLFLSMYVHKDVKRPQETYRSWQSRTLVNCEHSLAW